MLAENEPVASEPESPETDSDLPGEAKSPPQVGTKEEGKRRGRRSKEKERPAITLFDEAARRLQVCGRCSTLWAECRAKLAAEILEVARQSLEKEKEWLVLPWEPEVRFIVAKIYATPDDHEYYFFDSHCPECGRRFVYHVYPIGEILPSFRLHL